jgi:hypothetical protein
VRKERPHPGAQLRFTDADGMRPTCFATNTTGTATVALELRHRQRARAEDRVRAARDTGLRNLPLHHAAQNQLWLEVVQLALELLAWMPMLALTGTARRWEPKRLRLRLFSAAARLVTTGRRRILCLARSDHRTFAGYKHYRTRTDLQERLTRRATKHSRSRGTRRPPDATIGPSTWLPPPRQAKTAR